jgi:hypothetical protein
MKNPNLSSAEIDACGSAILMKHLSKLGYEVFSPIPGHGSARTDFIISDKLCEKIFALQLKSTQGEEVRSNGRQGSRGKSRSGPDNIRERNSPVNYNQHYLVTVNIVNEKVMFFPREFVQSRDGKKINMRTMSQYAVELPPANREINRHNKATLDMLY